MTSWGGTSMVTVLKSILTIMSTSGHNRKSPGPFGPPLDPAAAEDHTPLILLDDLDGAVQDRRHHYYGHHQGDEREAHADGLQEREPHKTVLLSGSHATDTDSTTARRTPDTREEGPSWISLSLPIGQRDSLEEPPRPNVAIYVVYAGDGHLVMNLGVDGSPVAHGYADVGDVSAAVLAPEEQVSRLGSTVDRGPVAHLPTR